MKSEGGVDGIYISIMRDKLQLSCAQAPSQGGGHSEGGVVSRTWLHGERQVSELRLKLTHC